jgi:hypothetical protein
MLGWVIDFIISVKCSHLFSHSMACLVGLMGAACIVLDCDQTYDETFKRRAGRFRYEGDFFCGSQKCASEPLVI